jgi:hypothetical protein
MSEEKKIVREINKERLLKSLLEIKWKRDR